MKLRAMALALAVLLLAGLAAKPAGAQSGPFWRARQARLMNVGQKQKLNPPHKNPPPPPKPNAGGVKEPNARNLEGLPPKWVENVRNMTPEQQERFMQNNERFKNLTPERQQQIRQNLQKWNNLSPEQKQEALDRETAARTHDPRAAAISHKLGPTPVAGDGSSATAGSYSPFGRASQYES